MNASTNKWIDKLRRTWSRCGLLHTSINFLTINTKITLFGALSHTDIYLRDEDLLDRLIPGMIGWPNKFGVTLKQVLFAEHKPPRTGLAQHGVLCVRHLYVFIIIQYSTRLQKQYLLF